MNPQRWRIAVGVGAVVALGAGSIALIDHTTGPGEQFEVAAQAAGDDAPPGEDPRADAEDAAAPPLYAAPPGDNLQCENRYAVGGGGEHSAETGKPRRPIVTPESIAQRWVRNSPRYERTGVVAKKTFFRYDVADASAARFFRLDIRTDEHTLKAIVYGKRDHADSSWYVTSVSYCTKAPSQESIDQNNARNIVQRAAREACNLKQQRYPCQ